MKRKHRLTASALIAPPPISSRGLERIRMSWPTRFMTAYPVAIAEAESVWAEAVLGHAPSCREDLTLVEQERTSLPVMWASFFRPLQDGRTGTDLALSWFGIHAPEMRPGLVRISQARGVYVECLQLEPDHRTVVMRDLFTGEIYRLRDLERKVVLKIRRWMRFYGLLVALGDGTWSYFSAFASLPTPELPDGSSSDLLPAAVFVEVARAALSQAGVNPAEIDPAAPHAGLRRYCGIAFASIGRWLRERPIPAPLPMYLVNSDGERLEYQEAMLELSPHAASRLATALPSATDFVQTGDTHWCWVSRQHTTQFAQGENMADLEGIGPRFAASASSPQRLVRLLDRLAELCNERPTILTLTVQRPWEQRKGVVSAPGEGIRTVTLTTGAPLFDMDEETARRNSPRLLLESVRHQLGQQIEALGGIPQDLVQTAEGRATVEQWLAIAEARGLPLADDEQPAFFDLDPLRVELGLRPVADQIARGLGSRSH